MKKLVQENLNNNLKLVTKQTEIDQLLKQLEEQKTLANDSSGKSNEGAKLLQEKNTEILSLKTQLNQANASVKTEGGQSNDAPRIITKMTANKEIDMYIF